MEGGGVLPAVILGLVQGLTEFLPVSSTGHLILVREALGLTTDYGLLVDAVLHLATAGAVLLYFRKDIATLLRTAYAWVAPGIDVSRADRVLFWALLVGTVPAALIGFFFESAISSVLRDPLFVSGGLIAGSVIFLAAERFATHQASLSVKKGFLIGLFQALALIPGMSRSGMVISGGLFLGLSREAAARFGFLLSFPIILGAGGAALADLGGRGILSGMTVDLIWAGSAAFVSGLLAIHFLLRFVRTHSLSLFVVYRLALAALVIVIATF